MNNTIVIALINEAGSKMTGEPVGSLLTVLDPEILAALDYRIVMNGQTVCPTQVLNSERFEYPCLVGRMSQLVNKNIDLNDIVFLNYDMIDLKTGCMRAEVEIIPSMATACTSVGWEDRVLRNFLVPEDVSLDDAIESLTKVLREVEMVPWLNTGGFETLAHKANESYKRISGNIANQLFNKQRLLNGHFLITYSNKFVTITIKLVAADQTEIQMLGSVWGAGYEETEKQKSATIPGMYREVTDPVFTEAERKALFWKHFKLEA